MNQIQIKQGDCLELMEEIPEESIDMVLCDLPYQVTGKHWDISIPFNELWKHYKRIIKQGGGYSFILQATFYE